MRSAASPWLASNLVYRDQLFPRPAYAQAFERLLAQTGERNACRTLVGLLALAHERTCEGELAQALEEEMQAARLPDLKGLQTRFGPKAATAPHVAFELGTLAAYDEILSWRPPPANDLVATPATEVVA